MRRPPQEAGPANEPNTASPTPHSSTETDTVKTDYSGQGFESDIPSTAADSTHPAFDGSPRKDVSGPVDLSVPRS